MASRPYLIHILTPYIDVKVGLESPAVRRKMEADTMNTQRSNTTYELSSSGNPLQAKNSGTGGGAPVDPVYGMKKDLENENNRFIRDQKQAQQLMLRQQDHNLSQLEKGVDSLGICNHMLYTCYIILLYIVYVAYVSTSIYYIHILDITT